MATVGFKGLMSVLFRGYRYYLVLSEIRLICRIVIHDLFSFSYLLLFIYLLYLFIYLVSFIYVVYLFVYLFRVTNDYLESACNNTPCITPPNATQKIFAVLMD